MGEVACAVCGDTGELQDSQAWDCGQPNSECPYCPHKVDEYRKEIAALRERVREAAEELSNPSVTFADPRVSYEEIQLTAGWRKEWLSYPEVVRALEEK